jgi:pyruvate dehydrogenase complex dehydrogenase (E1) component
MREHFCGPEPALEELVGCMPDDEIWDLRRGGLHHRNVYTAHRIRLQFHRHWERNPPFRPGEL